jgi:hypothetical protein
MNTPLPRGGMPTSLSWRSSAKPGAQESLVSERSLLFLCIALGTLQAWISRYVVISDGISYLDIGDAYFRGDWANAINAYWSPLYSWCLGSALYLFKPSIRWEFITVHIVNLIIYCGALFAFRFFLRSVLRALREDSASSAEVVPLPEAALLVLGYGLFLWCSLVLIDVGWVTPDLLTAAIVFLMAGYLVELRLHPSYGRFAVFGVLAGLAYLSKGIMFPLGFGFLAILLFSGRRSRHRVLGVMLSFGMFLLVCAPFIFALSKAKGRLTFGDTGKLNYAALVSPGSPQRDWQGDPPGSGIPRHPTRQLLESPPVFEFGEPIQGTYPPWDDPSYWNEGVRPRFRLAPQLQVLTESGFAYGRLLIGESGLLAGLLIFVFLGGKPTRRTIAANWPLLAVAGLSLVAYSLVLVQTRYLGASFALLWIALFAGVRLPREQRFETVANCVAAAVAITIAFSVAGYLANTAQATLSTGADPSPTDQVRAAVGLENMGLRIGDKVAVIGSGLTNHWARLARLRIVAEVSYDGWTNTGRFWASSPERRDKAYECLSHTGARGVVAWDPPSVSQDPRWHRISDTRYYIYFFPAESTEPGSKP